MSNEQKEMENQYIKLLADWFEIQEWQRHFNCSNREARRDISDFAKTNPVLATSSRKGYKLAQTADDVPHAKHTVAELKSRIRDMQKRIKPLEKFIKQHESEVTNG